jgi:hypothetical protein
MGNRTLKFIGNAFSADGSDVNVAFSINNVEVFNGSVTASAGEMPVPSISAGSELFSFELDGSVTGVIPVSISVTGGDLQFETLYSNYVYTNSTDDPTVTFGTLSGITETNKVKTAVQVDGVSVDTSSSSGDFVVNIYNGADCSMNYYIDPNNVHKALS